MGQVAADGTDYLVVASRGHVIENKQPITPLQSTSSRIHDIYLYLTTHYSQGGSLNSIETDPTLNVGNPFKGERLIAVGDKRHGFCIVVSYEWET